MVDSIISTTNAGDKLEILAFPEPKSRGEMSARITMAKVVVEMLDDDPRCGNMN